MQKNFERLLLDDKWCISSLEIKNSSKKLQQRDKEITALEKVLMSYELYITNYFKC